MIGSRQTACGMVAGGALLLTSFVACFGLAPSAALADTKGFVASGPATAGKLVIMNSDPTGVGGLSGSVFTSLDGTTPSAIPVTIQFRPFPGSANSTAYDAELFFYGSFDNAAVWQNFGPPGSFDYSYTQAFTHQEMVLTDVTTGATLLRWDYAGGRLGESRRNLPDIGSFFDIRSGSANNFDVGFPGELRPRGGFSISGRDESGFPFAPGSGAPSQVIDASIVFRADAPVPEPAAWLLMILGCGITGAALRHRRDGLRPAEA